MQASIVQWLEFAPSKHEVRVRFPVDAEIKQFFLCKFVWACGVMVSTRDSESLDPGSNPGKPFLQTLGNIKQYTIALVAQWIAHRTSNPGVAGSSPAQGKIKYYFCFFFPFVYICNL
jgi:hypothetical protein